MPVQTDWQATDRHGNCKILENADYAVEGTFRNVRVAPTAKELRQTDHDVLRSNLTSGAFSDVNTYLATHFHLYREDFLRPFRTSFQELVKNQKEYLSGRKNLEDVLPHLRIYKKVRFHCMINRRGQPIEQQFVRLHHSDYEGVNWNESDRLLPYSLVLLAQNQFRDIYVATVHRDVNRSASLGRGKLSLMFEDSPPVTCGEEEFILVESKQYFGAYSATLQILQNLQAQGMPFKSFIVDVHPTIKPPVYLKYATAPVAIEGHSVNLLDDTTWPSHAELSLNPMQFQALKTCLTQELAIIQGPPGTGKTFMALKVIEICLRNPDFWNPGPYRAAPILIVCYTNHALDQFLEGVLEIFAKLGQRPSLVRVGRRSESKKLKPYTLNVLSGGSRKSTKDLLRKARIIGMTTTGAAISSYILRETTPRIVIVEEAAEVVECHMIPCLLPACQHLILIGDHKQLRPCVTDDELAWKFHLDISLFERLVNNDLNLCTLNVQHRMRPEIAALLVPAIYAQLDPAPNVREYSDVLGMEANVFCVTHSQKESQSPKSVSKCNTYEAEFLTALSCYLIQQGYKPSQITVLATYAAQVTLLQEHLKRVEMCAEVEATTVDGFQGKENDIILLSLVRSNDEANIGFLKKDNRVCVALSRAKIGLFIIGNIDVLKSGSKTWNTIYEKLLARQEVGAALKIKCQKHGKIQDIVLPSDFKRLAPRGGCNEDCEKRLTCGHVCKLKCNPRDRDHENYFCQSPCERKCENGHLCSGRLCHESCPPCSAPYDVLLPCGHVSSLPCILAQDHQELEKCSKQCQEKCEYYFDPQKGGCGHYCKGTCADCGQGHSHVNCGEACNRTLNCGHGGKDHQCWEPCPPCDSCEDDASHLSESAGIETNYTERMILSDEDSMKYLPTEMIYEQQKRSESFSVLSSSLGPGWPTSGTTSGTLPLLNNTEDAFDGADITDVLSLANEIYRTRVLEDYILLKRELLMFLVADIDPLNEVLFTCKQVRVEQLSVIEAIANCLRDAQYFINEVLECRHNCVRHNEIVVNVFDEFKKLMSTLKDEMDLILDNIRSFEIGLHSIFRTHVTANGQN